MRLSEMLQPSRFGPVFVLLLMFVCVPALRGQGHKPRAAAIDCPGFWEFVTGSGPSQRFGPAMAYDSTRRQIVLFGGSDLQSNRIGDTWEWDGTVWIKSSKKGPSPRGFSAMAYNSDRHETVLFGGVGTANDPFEDNQDTWEWDGIKWTEIAVDGPPKRNAHGLAYDSGRQQTVLFGGGVTFDGRLQDTWELQSTQWTERHPVAKPDERVGLGMAYDSARGRTVLFGGNFDTYFGDTWEWDGANWTQVATTGPKRRSFPYMAYDSARRRTVLFGGQNATTTFGDTWEWDGANWTQVATTGPEPRLAGAAAYDSGRGKVVLFGGDSTNSILRHDTWQWVGPIYVCAGRATGDLNCDSTVDRDDLTILVSAKGTDACGPNDPRDLNHDGRIKRGDAQQLVGHCTHLGCGAQ
jgi:hypothetical protein